MPRKPTKQQMEEGMRPWREYLNPLMKKGALETALPVQWKGKTVTSTDTKDYKPQKVDLGGYMIVKAKNMAEAVKIAKKSPHAMTRMGPTTIRECVEMQM